MILYLLLKTRANQDLLYASMITIVGSGSDEVSKIGLKSLLSVTIMVIPALGMLVVGHGLEEVQQGRTTGPLHRSLDLDCLSGSIPPCLPVEGSASPTLMGSECYITWVPSSR